MRLVLLLDCGLIVELFLVRYTQLEAPVHGGRRPEAAKFLLRRLRRFHLGRFLLLKKNGQIFVGAK